MFLAQEEVVTNCYVSIKVSHLSLIEDSMSFNNTIKIQEDILEFRSGLGDTKLVVTNDPVSTVMV